MGPVGEQYKPRDPSIPTPHSHKCLFKRILLGLMGAFSLSVVGVITWVITKSVYQVGGSEDSTAYVMAASYLLSKMDTDVDPCENFPNYSCGTWRQNQWRDDVTFMSLEEEKRMNRIEKYLSDEVAESDLTAYKNLKIMHQKCLSSNQESDGQDVENWLDEVFGFLTSEEVINFAGELGLFVFYEINTDIGPLHMDVLSRYSGPLSIESNVEEAVAKLPQDFGQKDNILEFSKNKKDLISEPMTVMTVQDFIDGTKFVHLTQYFAAFGLGPSDTILSTPSLISTTVEFIDNTFSEEAEILKFVQSYVGALIYRKFYLLTLIEKSFNFCYNGFASSYFGFTVGSLMLDREKSNYSETVETVENMVEYITLEYKEMIKESKLLTDTGKTAALKKLDNLKVYVGAAPWINNNTHLQKHSYAGELDETMSFVALYRLVGAYQQKLKIQSFISPPKDFWEQTMGPQIFLNAVYYQDRNSISIPTGAFIPPYYDEKWPLAMKYGALGSIIGHEISHAFDNKGMHFDSEGVSSDLWDSENADSMIQAQQCLVKQYSAFGHQPYTVDGNSTLNENFADNGGITVSYRAFKKEERRIGKSFKIHGLNLNSDKMFYLAYAQIRCYKYSLTNLYDEYYIDYHTGSQLINLYSPPDFRVTGPIQNSKHFSEAFSCPPSSQMCASEKCRTL